MVGASSMNSSLSVPAILQCVNNADGSVGRGVGATVRTSTVDSNRGDDGDGRSSNNNTAVDHRLPPRPLFLDHSMDDLTGRLAGRRRGGRAPSHLSTSMPLWGGGRSDGGGGGRSPPRQALSREGGLDWDRGEAQEGLGVGEGRDGAASAAMDMLREVERMHVSSRMFTGRDGS